MLSFLHANIYSRTKLKYHANAVVCSDKVPWFILMVCLTFQMSLSCCRGQLFTFFYRQILPEMQHNVRRMDVSPEHPSTSNPPKKNHFSFTKLVLFFREKKLHWIVPGWNGFVTMTLVAPQVRNKLLPSTDHCQARGAVCQARHSFFSPWYQ
jgi:hypothetical protein